MGGCESGMNVSVAGWCESFLSNYTYHYRYFVMSDIGVMCLL